MKRPKTTLIITVSILVLSLIFYFVPFDTLLGKIPFVKEIYNNTTLSINLKNGDADVKINDKSYGKTPLVINNLVNGEYTIVLSKISESEVFYKDHSFDIYLAQNTEARIDIEIGPNSLLQGVVLYYTAIPKGSGNTGLVTITSSPLGSKILLDGELLSNTPLSGYLLTKGQYTIKMSKTGYEELETPIIIREGYHLNVKGFLFPVPLTLETAINESE